ncbi:MAG: sulfurtransferase, partial [Candidatus Latescibacterota bacterium]
DESLVVVQMADVEFDYMRGHIPGARFLWPGWLEKSSPATSVELFSIERMDSVLERLGISNDSRVVLCHTYTTFSAACVARAWTVLDYLGMGERVHILNGGFEAWNAQDLPVTTEVPTYEWGSFAPSIKKDVFVDVDYVKSRFDTDGVRVVDMRRAKDYKGHVKGVIRAGHIPGAINLPLTTFMDKSLCYASSDDLRSRLEDAGIKPGTDIISYCYKGRSACIAYVVGRMLGYDVHVYDGSAEEWGALADLPIAVAAK